MTDTKNPINRSPFEPDSTGCFDIQAVFREVSETIHKTVDELSGLFGGWDGITKESIAKAMDEYKEVHAAHIEYLTWMMKNGRR